MPTVDLQTGLITGCKKGSFAWWHEKGHIEFNKTDQGAEYNYLQLHFLQYGVLFCALTFFFNVFKYLAIWASLMVFYYYLYEELWCNRYAKRKIRKGVKK